MANKQRGYVDIELDKPRKLKFSMNSLAELEDKLGYPVSQINQDKVGIKELRAMIWAGLLHEEPKLTLRGAGDLIDLQNLTEIASKVTEALTLAFGSQNQKNEMSDLENGIGEKQNE